MAEAFVKTFKRDYVYVHDRPDAKTIMAQLDQWFEDYNEYHPHKGLKMKSPRQFIRSQLLTHLVRFNRGNSRLSDCARHARVLRRIQSRATTASRPFSGFRKQLRLAPQQRVPREAYVSMPV
jgi:hypothetical protein